MNQIHYVVGIGRSGTSLLMSLLGAHPEIHCPPENYFRTFFRHAYAEKKEFTPREIKRILEFNRAFHELQPVVGYDYEVPPNLETENFKGDYDELCALIYKCYIHKSFPNKIPTIIVDKNPSNTLFLNQIRNNSPKAKFILMVRDYRANILSRKQSIHLLSPNVVFNAVRWAFFTVKAYRFKKKYPKDVLVVRYEDLVENKDKTLGNILEFLKVKPIIDTDEAQKERKTYMEYKLHDTTKGSERAQKKYNDLAKPIFKNRIDQWKVDLSSKEIRIADHFCSTLGKEFHYQSEASNSSIGWETRFIAFYYILKVQLSYMKDVLTYYAPIQWKVNRFKIYVKKIERKRRSIT